MRRVSVAPGLRLLQCFPARSCHQWLFSRPLRHATVNTHSPLLPTPRCPRPDLESGSMSCDWASSGACSLSLPQTFSPATSPILLSPVAHPVHLTSPPLSSPTLPPMGNVSPAAFAYP